MKSRLSLLFKDLPLPTLASEDQQCAITLMRKQQQGQQQQQQQQQPVGDVTDKINYNEHKMYLFLHILAFVQSMKIEK